MDDTAQVLSYFLLLYKQLKNGQKKEQEQTIFFLNKNQWTKQSISHSS